MNPLRDLAHAQCIDYQRPAPQFDADALKRLAYEQAIHARIRRTFRLAALASPAFFVVLLILNTLRPHIALAVPCVMWLVASIVTWRLWRRHTLPTAKVVRRG